MRAVLSGDLALVHSDDTTAAEQPMNFAPSDTDSLAGIKLLQPFI
jgi:hypothetical protein